MAAGKKKKTAAVKPFAGKRFSFFGEFAVWPGYHGRSPADLAKHLGASLAAELDASVDVVVFGDLRGTGRAAAKKKAERLVAAAKAKKSRRRLEVLDEGAFRELVRADLKKKRFAFIGGFDCSPEGTGMLEAMVKTAGGVTAPVDDQLDYLIVGNRRGPSKVATQNQASRLNDEGASITFLDETSFLELVRVDQPKKASGGALDFPAFISRLYGHVDEGKLGRALDMLRQDRFKLFSHLDDRRVVGIVRSQSGSGSVYASWLSADGRYGCCQPDLSDCMGLQGAVCKHLLVLVVGLARTQQLPVDRALEWVRGAQGKGPRRDSELCAETFIQFKGAEAGTVDWRPTETVPEDFYAI